jgi:hypothetical protein
MNGYSAVCIIPDGGKFNSMSDTAQAREKLKSWLRQQRELKRPLYAEWVEVSFGEFGYRIPDGAGYPQAITHSDAFFSR